MRIYSFFCESHSTDASGRLSVEGIYSREIEVSEYPGYIDQLSFVIHVTFENGDTIPDNFIFLIQSGEKTFGFEFDDQTEKEVDGEDVVFMGAAQLKEVEIPENRLIEVYYDDSNNKKLINRLKISKPD